MDDVRCNDDFLSLLHRIEHHDATGIRCPIIHVKDMREGKIGLAVGEGTLDWKTILAAAKPLPLQNYAVETGAHAGDVMEKLRLSEVYLRDLSL